MKKCIPLVLLIFVLFDHVLAQQASVKGSVADTIEARPLPNSAVLLLRRSDSILIRYTRTDRSGNFLLKNVLRGRYLLRISYPGYADYIDELQVADSLPLELPPISLLMRSKLLEAVIVSANKGPILIKGDTVEFRADSFHVQAGATVEELLKKLPGIQVDKNGKITAQGQTVQKVLVDGEEFFGDDPTLVTQNLQADMVDKVQLYDKKSDQAAFTGIDDGERTKTLNLKLKDNKKNGYFGKVSAGAGTDGYYDNQAMINLFKNKQKLAAYGIISNTGKTGLNWQERDNYGQSFADLANVDDATGNVSINLPDNDLENWDGRYSGQGIPAVKTGGLHYNDKWDNDRQSFSGNYKLMQLTVADSSVTNSEFILPDSLYYNNQTERSNNQILRQSADIKYEDKFDSTSTLKLMADGGTDHKTTNSLFGSEALAQDSSLVNQNTRSISTLGDKGTINSDLSWRKKLPKKGRTLSFDVRENYTADNSTGYLLSNTQFFSKGLAASDSLIDQYKEYHTHNILLDSRISYTEPLSAVSLLSVNYGVSLNDNHSDRGSFNKSASGKYDALDSLYSNDYQFNTFTHTGGLGYSLMKKKMRLSLGSNLGFTSFDQRDLGADTSIRRTFTNWYPYAGLTWYFTQQRRLILQYNGSTIQPTVQQLQPVQTNEDPLNITIGNPGLKPQFANRFNLNFFDYQVLTERSIGAYIAYTFTGNAISNEVNTDSTGRRVSRSINVNGNYTFSGNINYNFKWKQPGLNIGLSGNVDLSNNVSVVNDLENATHSGTYRLGFQLNKSKDKKYEFGLQSFAMYTMSLSSINTIAPTDFWTYDIDPGGDLYLPLKFQLHADCDVNLRPKTSVFDNNTNVVLLNGWLGKKFLKNDALLLKVSANDLLNQNIGFSRTVNSNFINQNTYSTIKRYFMLSVSWNFTKAGGPAPAQR